MQGINPINWKKIYWNFSFMHYLISFGFDNVAGFLYKQDEINIYLAYHNYFNYKNYFPGLEIELIDYPFKFNNDYKIFISGTIQLWLQPQDQQFTNI